MRVLGYLGWLQLCCNATAQVPGVVVRVLLGSSHGTRGGC